MNTNPALATAFNAQADVRPLLAWSSSQMRWLQDRLQALVTEWQAAWAIKSAPADVDAEMLVTPSFLGNGTTVSWMLDADLSKGAESAALHAMQVALFGSVGLRPAASGAGPEIAQDVARAAWTDWLRRLESMFGTPVIPNVEDPFDSEELDTAVSLQMWSGALCASIVWCGSAWQFLMPGTVVQRLLQSAGITKTDDSPARTPPPLVNLAAALDTHALEVRAELSPVTLTLGELETLSIGDIVVIPHQLTMPLQVIGPRDDVLCEAWLGKQSGRVALELVRHTATSDTAILSV